MRCYSVFDVKSEIYLPLLTAVSDRDAVRKVAGMAKPGSPLHDFASDFQLMFVGNFDDVTGHFTQVDNPEHVSTLSSILDIKREVV